MAEPVKLRRAKEGGVAAETREWIAAGFTRVEDVVYVGLGVLLGASALALLVATAVSVTRMVTGGVQTPDIVEILDRILLIVMIVEILYTVQVSFREHTLVPEPFLIIGLIAATRRILVLTAEIGELLEQGGAVFRNALIELAVLTGMVLVLVVSLVMLRRRAPEAVADRG